MNNLRESLQEYIDLRRGLGYKMRDEGLMLPRFVSFMEEHHAELQTREQVDQALRLLTGHVDLVKVGDKVLQLPRRIAFSTLSQDEWTDYLSRAKDAVCEHLLPGVDGDEIQNEILRLAA